MKGMCTFFGGTLVAGLMTCCILTASAQDLRVGDPADKVQRVLGEPSGYMRAGTWEIYVYNRGRVETRDGKVTVADLIPAEQARAQSLREAQQSNAEAKAELADEARLAALKQSQAERRADQTEAAQRSLLAQAQETAEAQQAALVRAQAQAAAEAQRAAAAAQQQAALNAETVYAAPIVSYGYAPACVEPESYGAPIVLPFVTAPQFERRYPTFETRHFEGLHTERHFGGIGVPGRPINPRRSVGSGWHAAGTRFRDAHRR